MEQFLQAVREGREEYETEYRPEYERLKREREQLDMKKKGEAAGGSGKGTEVDIGGLCHSMREEVEVPDNIRQAIFLRHPGDEEDMEEEEEEDREQEEESREGDSFKAFIKSRTDVTEEKIKNLHIDEH